MLNKTNTGNKFSVPVILLVLIFSFSANAKDNNPPDNLKDSNNDPAAKNYALKVEKLVNGFEGMCLFAGSSSVDTKHDLLLKMNAVYEEFISLQHNSPDNPMVLELKRLVGSWMEMRMNYFAQLITEADETKAAHSLLEKSNGIYNPMISQIGKVKS